MKEINGCNVNAIKRRRPPSNFVALIFRINHLGSRANLLLPFHRVVSLLTTESSPIWIRSRAVTITIELLHQTIKNPTGIFHRFRFHEILLPTTHTWIFELLKFSFILPPSNLLPRILICCHVKYCSKLVFFDYPSYTRNINRLNGLLAALFDRTLINRISLPGNRKKISLWNVRFNKIPLPRFSPIRLDSIRMKSLRSDSIDRGIKFDRAHQSIRHDE